jgi:23S rRNA (guanine745-N1)-methyltransferase
MNLCTVRNCGQPLRREERRMVCPQGHSFDIARSGYLNLLQPQDRKSRNPGDTPEAVAARRRLHDRGITQLLLHAIAEILKLTENETILDAGCGEGFYLGSLARQSHAAGHGIDISLPAIDAAARRYPECQWVVANADRFLPWPDASFSAVTSITARMNRMEFCRVLKPEGRLLIALPAPDDLIELRGQGRDRVARTLEDFASQFEPIRQTRATTSADLDAEGVHDILHSIYRPLRAEPVTATRVTFSLDLILLRPRL